MPDAYAPAIIIPSISTTGFNGRHDTAVDATASAVTVHLNQSVPCIFVGRRCKVNRRRQPEKAAGRSRGPSGRKAVTAGRAKQAMAPVVTIKAETTRPWAVPRGRREVKIKAEKKADLSRDPEPDTVVIRTNVAQPAATIPSMVARASFSKNMGMYGEWVQPYTRLIVPSRDDRPWQPRSTDVRRRSPGASIPGGGYPPHQPLQDEYIVRAFDDVSDDDSIIMSPPPPTPPSVAVECSWPAAQTESRLETIDRGVEHRVARPPAANDPIPLTPSPAASYMARQASTKIKTHAPRQLFSPVLQ